MTFEFELISGAFFSIIDLYVLYILFNHKLTFRFSKNKVFPAYLVSYALVMLGQFLPGFFPSYPLKLPLMLAFWISLIVIHSGSIIQRTFWVACSFLVLALCELVMMPITLWITDVPFEAFLDTKSTYLLGMFLTRTLFFVIVKWFIRSKYADKQLFSGFTRETFAIILIDFIYFLLIAYLFYHDSVFLDINTAIVLSLCVLFVISVLSIYLLQKVMKKSDEILNASLKLQQAEMEYKLTSDMTSVVENLRSLRHDMNNHMSILQGLLSVKAYDDMEAYLTSITQELSVANNFYFPENKVLSVLLNSKISNASQLGIRFETEIRTSATPFSERDLCTLIGNILGNAIEASASHADPYIYFSIYHEAQQLHIQCDNTYSIAPIFENGKLLTTKENKTTHGIGTQNIRSVVEAYHGTVEFSADEQFHVRISIPV